jgi:hypothetical protein
LEDILSKKPNILDEKEENLADLTIKPSYSDKDVVHNQRYSFKWTRQQDI